MILSKITIHGFKSFAKKIELRFDGLITAVVGPNGCGKTNIVDAIRWGLGEQKTAVLRTDRMENVIFGGAQSSKPLGMAEVSVTFDNSSNILPIDYSEVVLTRRLYRSGESEYLLNKSQVRLKDINDLIMDTGIGADAYSVIELKMVEDILSEKAEDRRKLMEEAAGVTKYKHRLKAAIRKLDATQNDLLRVNDIIQEVERNVSSLKRQVQRAKRNQVLQENLKDLELLRSASILANLLQKIGPLKKELQSFKKQKEGRTTTITKEEADLERLQLELVEQEKGITKIRGELNETVERIHQRESDIRVGKERISSLCDQIDRFGREIENLSHRLTEQTNHLKVAQQDREAFQVKVTSTGRIFANKKKELEVFTQGLNLKRLDLNRKKKEIIECLESLNQLNSEEISLRAKIDNSQGRLERLDEEDAASRDANNRAKTKQQSVKLKLQKLQSQHKAILQKKTQVGTEISKLRALIETSKEYFFRDQGELELLEGRLHFLMQVIENREGISEGARKILQEDAPGVIGLLADVVQVKSEHRQAVEVGLGALAQVLLVDQVSNAYRALKILKRRGGGRVSLMGLDRLQNLPKREDLPKISPTNSILGWASDLVSCESRVQSVVDFLLQDLLIVNDLDAAQNVLSAHADQRFRIATLTGELLTDWGMVQSVKADDQEVGMIGRQQRIKELEDKIQSLKKKLDDSKKNLDKNESKRDNHIQENNRIERELTEALQQISDVEKEGARIQFEQETANEGLKKNVEERQKLLAEIETCRDRLENVRPRMEALVEKREKVENESAKIQVDVDHLEEEERVQEEAVHRLNLTIVRLNGEAKNLDFDIERSQSLIKEINETIIQRKQEIEEAKITIEKYKTETSANEKALINDYKEKEERETKLQKQDEKHQALRENVQTRERDVRQTRRDREEGAERIHNLEMEIAELEHEAKTIRERIWESYDVDIQKVTPQENINMEQVDDEVEELKRKIKGLGAVNMMALEEFNQENERLEFLNTQRDDLISAETTLNETIQKINETARKRFLEVFGEVKKNFQETFKRFFQGGEADLRLPEDEDPLEAQIEIIARPAGKHFRDLSLLSGGERALTAISLLFALYLVKPSPFCILDEIDAPLDDANVERFTRVLREYAEKTQFIIVTHNKMTMRAAGTLYGVTMEEEGVSKIVSVKFEDNKKVETATAIA